MTDLSILREHRLDRIRKGLTRPRAHCSEEMEAWEEGRIGRLLVYLALGGIFACLGLVGWSGAKSLPAGRYVAAIEGAR